MKGEQKKAQSEPKVVMVNCREGVLARDRMRRVVVGKDVVSIKQVDWHGYMVKVSADRDYFIPMGTVIEAIYES